MAVYKGFIALWRPGTGNLPIWTSGSGLGAFVDLGNTYFQTGIRLAYLDYYDVFDSYTGLWVPGSGAQHFQAEMDRDTFLSVDSDQFHAGRRLISLDRSGDEYLAVWRAGFGTGAQHVGVELSGQGLEDMDAQQRAAGRRMTILLQTGNEFTAVWRTGSGLEWFAGGKGYGEFWALDTGYKEKGFRLVSLYDDSGNWSGVWRPGSGGQAALVGVNATDLESNNKEFGAKGLHLTVLHAKRFHT